MTGSSREATPETTEAMLARVRASIDRQPFGARQ